MWKRWASAGTLAVLLMGCGGGDGDGLTGTERREMCAPMRELANWWEVNPPLSAPDSWGDARRAAFSRAAEEQRLRADTYRAMQDFAPDGTRSTLSSMSDFADAVADDIDDLLERSVNDEGIADGYTLGGDPHDIYADSKKAVERIESICEIDIEYWTPEDDYIGT